MSHNGVSFTKIQTAIFKTIGAAIKGNVCTENNMPYTEQQVYHHLDIVLRTNDVTDFQPHCYNNTTRIKWYTIVIDELSHFE